MKTAADLKNMPTAEYYGYCDGLDGSGYCPVSKCAAAKYKHGYDAGVADFLESKQSAADLADEQDTVESIWRG